MHYKLELINDSIKCDEVEPQGLGVAMSYSKESSAQLSSLLGIYGMLTSYVTNGEEQCIFINGKKAITYYSNSPETELDIMSDRINFNLI